MRLEYRFHDLSTLFEYNLSVLSQNVIDYARMMPLYIAEMHMDGLNKTDPNVVQEFLKGN